MSRKFPDFDVRFLFSIELICSDSFRLRASNRHGRQPSGSSLYGRGAGDHVLLSLRRLEDTRDCGEYARPVSRPDGRGFVVDVAAPVPNSSSPQEVFPSLFVFSNATMIG